MGTWIRHSFPGYNGGEMNLWECPECHAAVWEQLYVNVDPATGARALHEQWHAGLAPSGRVES